MTVLNKFQQMLISNGMFESQAEAVMSIAKEQIDEATDDYEFNFNAPSDSYSDVIYNTVYNITIKPIALKWIIENKPQAWFKPMFE